MTLFKVVPGVQPRRKWRGAKSQAGVGVWDVRQQPRPQEDARHAPWDPNSRPPAQRVPQAATRGVGPGG